MNKKFTSFLTLALLVVFSMSTFVEASAQELSKRVISDKHDSQSTIRFSKVDTERAPVMKVTKPDADYGTEINVLNENFAGLPNGSIGNPDLTTELTLADAEYPWMNFKPGYMNMEGWGAINAWQAGGTICLNANMQNPARLNTPMLDVSGQGGIVFVRFKARTADGYAQNVLLEAAETFNMSPTWSILGGYPMPQVGPEWQTYEAYYYGGGSYTIFNLVAFDHPIYVDDFEVFVIDQYVDTPVALPHTNYLGTSFDARWSKVADAQDYLLDVYSINTKTAKQDFLLENQVVADTVFTVPNTVSGATYYYRVKSRNGAHTSIVSKEKEVFDLEVPSMNPVTDLAASDTEVTYSASWSDVPTAERYNYFARFKRFAENNGMFYVTKEDFEGVADADGNQTGWTIENPSYNTYDELYINEMTQAGWRGTHYAPYTNYICLDAFHYIYDNGDAGLISPELDLSKDGGKIDLSVNLHATAYIVDGAVEGYTRAAIALFNFNEEKGDYDQAELHYITEEDGLVDKWKVFNVQLTKGTSRSVIGIYAVYAPENLYIDDLTITQNYQNGESLMDPFLFKRYLESSTYQATVPQRVYGKEVFHQVAAVKVAPETVQFQGYRVTPFSPLELVGVSPTPTSIDEFNLAKATVQVIDNEIVINNPNHEVVNIHDFSGKLVYNNQSGLENLRISLDQRGAYIVQVGRTSVKLIY